MFEDRIRTITSYNYSSDLYERALKYKNIVIYGAGSEGKDMKETLLRIGGRPLFFWDINADAKVEGFEVKYPDFEAIAKEDRKDYFIIVALIVQKKGYLSVREKLIEHGYTEHAHSYALRPHLDAMYCFLKGGGIERCKSCHWLYTQCFCINEKYIGKGFIKEKFLMPCRISIKYENRKELSEAAGKCASFCDYFSSTQTALIVYKTQEHCGDELYSLVVGLLEVGVGIVTILCGKSDMFPAEILNRLEKFKSCVHFFCNNKNKGLQELLDKEGFTYQMIENAEFTAQSLKDYDMQCSGCLFAIFPYQLHCGNKIGYRCGEIIKNRGDCSQQCVIDVDGELPETSEELLPLLERVDSALYFYGKCEKKIIFSKRSAIC